MFNQLKNLLLSKNDNTDRNFSANDDLVRFFNKNNCKFDVENDDDNDEKSQSRRYYFDFQGGHFVAATSKNDKGVDVTFPGFETVSIDELNLVRAMCNKFNAQSSVFKVVYTTETDDNIIRIHLSFFVNVIVEEQLHELLNACFYFQRSFIEEYENAKRNQDAWKTNDLELKINDKTREQYLIASQEIKHEHNDTMRVEDGADFLTVETLICRIFDDMRNDEGIEWENLTVVRDCKSTTIIDDRDSYLITSLLVTGEGKNAIFGYDQAVAIVNCTKNGEPITFTITAQKEGEDSSSLYMRVGVSRMYSAPSPNNSLTNNDEKAHFFSLLIAYDKSSSSEKAAEADFMWKEAMTKLKNGEKLTDEERLIANVVVPDVAYNIYWGEKLMLSQRYVEALKHLKNAFYAMRTRCLDLNKRERATFSELCYKIGFCLIEIRQYEKAYFYLDFLRDNGNIRHNTELVNCLVNGKDLRSFQVIDILLGSITQQIESDEEEEVNENILSFYNFLKRRKAYALIDFGKIDEAEEAFRAMLEEPANSDYAMRELAYIQNLRKQKSYSANDSESGKSTSDDIDCEQEK